jgi:hypothetical protein
MGRFVTLKKIGSKIWSAKNRLEKIGSGLFFVIQKEKKQPGLFSFKLQIETEKYGLEPKKILSRS